MTARVPGKSSRQKDSFLRNQSGATSIEYGMIVSGIALVIFTAINLVGADLSAFFNTLVGAF